MRVTEETAPDGRQLCVSSDVTSLKVNEADLRRARDAALVVSITDKAPTRAAAGGTSPRH